MRIPSSSSLVFATLALSSSSSNLSVLSAPTSETASEASIGPSSSNHHIASRRGSFNFPHAERDSLDVGRGSFPHVDRLPRSSSSKRNIAQLPSADISDLHRRGGCEELLGEVLGRITPLAPLGGALQPVLHTIFGLPVVGGILGGLCSDKAPHAAGVESLQSQGQLSMQQAESSMQSLAASIENAFGNTWDPSSPPVGRAEQADAFPTDDAPVKPPVSPPSAPTDKLPVSPPSAPSPPIEKIPSPPTDKLPVPADKLPVQPPVSPPAPPNTPAMPHAAAAIEPPVAASGTVHPPVSAPTVTPPVDVPAAKLPVQPPVAPPVAADPKHPGDGASVQTPPTVVVPMDPPTPGTNAKSVEDGSDDQDGQEPEDEPEDGGAEGDEPQGDEDESSQSAPSRRRL